MELEDRKFTIEVPQDLDAYDTVEVFRLMMYALTFHPDTIKELMPEE